MIRKLAALAVAGSVTALATSGCVEDTACGVCDDKNLVLQILAGPNYALEQVRIVSPECEGERCPPQFDRATYFVESVGPCEETDAALASPRGVDEYCKIAPVVVSSGLQFVFNNLLDPSYVEVIRKRPDNPNLFETYDWKTQILAVRGPISRYAGDWRSGGATKPDRMTRFVSLSCVDNLRRSGITYAPEELAGLCNALGDDGLPRKLQPYNGEAYSGAMTGTEPAELSATRGKWDDRAIGEAAAIDCDTPVDGPDTCCSQCDWSLGVAVSKYGVQDERLACDPNGDRLLDCAAFEPYTDRGDEPGCEALAACVAAAPDKAARAACIAAETSCRAIPKEDRLRELHPSERVDERLGPACVSNSECRDGARIGLVGAECIGTNADGQLCALDAGDPACTGGSCRAPWFVECRVDPDTTGAQGYCVDARHDTDAAAGCYELRTPPAAGDDRCQDVGECSRVSECDADADGHLTAAECCPDGTSCDPVADLADATPRPRYDRKDTLPGVVRALDCGDAFDFPSDDDLDRVCDEGLDCRRRAPTEDFPDGHILEVCNSETCKQCVLGRNADEITTKCRVCKEGDDANCKACDEEAASVCSAQTWVQQTCDESEDAHDWAVNFVTRLGGVIYDPALKGVEWRPADLGGTPRAVIEACAEERGLIAARNVADGWRAHDADGVAVEHEAEWDIGLCSGQRYEIVFQDREDGEYLRDKVGNTLEGKSTYVFETPDFHVVPDSGFPNDSLRIGACDTFSLSFSNKYDLSPENLDKLQLVDVGTGVGVAGGTGCARDREDAAARPDAIPCLTVDVADQPRGVVHARVDPVQFGSVLVPGRTYELSAPGIDAAGATYATAFWDACGMPLVLGYTGGTENEPEYVAAEYSYRFTVDATRCEDDEDGDGVELSCDNAPDLYNPTQLDADFDGFGDAADLCPASSSVASETGDSDRDGVGNACDACARAPSRYNEQANALALPPELQVRNIPLQGDADEDGIGDVCDNCPTVANCGDYDAAHPWRLGDPLDLGAGECQRDADLDMVGDACIDTQSDTAAGKVGLGETDDFDQDGLANQDDACPRQPELARIECVDDSECPAFRECTDGDSDPETPSICNHLDGDADGIGDVCDTCPGRPNAEQVLEGGLQEDDADGDFIGLDCELGPECGSDAGPRPIAFHAVSAAGACCTTLLVLEGADLVERASGRRLADADGKPVRLVCNDADCRELPVELVETPGVLELPAGCDEALADAGMSVEANPAIDTEETHGDLDALWNLQCRLPPLDQDYDALADGCDLCPFAFDPSNAPYYDETGKLWPHDGAVCSGQSAGANVCEGVPGEGDDDTGGTSGDGGSSESGG